MCSCSALLPVWDAADKLRARRLAGLLRRASPSSGQLLHPLLRAHCTAVSLLLLLSPFLGAAQEAGPAGQVTEDRAGAGAKSRGQPTRQRLHGGLHLTQLQVQAGDAAAGVSGALQSTEPESGAWESERGHQVLSPLPARLHSTTAEKGNSLC